MLPAASARTLLCAVKLTQGAVFRIARGRQALLRGKDFPMRSIDLDLRGLQVVFGALQAAVRLLGRGLRAPCFMAGGIGGAACPIRLAHRLGLAADWRQE